MTSFWRHPFASNLTPKSRSGANPMIQRQQEYQAKSGYVHTRRPGYSTYFRASTCADVGCEAAGSTRVSASQAAPAVCAESVPSLG